MNHSTLLDPLHDVTLDGLDFVRVAFDLFEQVYGLPDDGKALRERKGDVKPLLEEVLPIARYVLAHYAHGQYISVRWIRGSQSFDAKVESHGGRVDHGAWPAHQTIEVTSAQHPNEYLLRERLNAGGGAFGLDGLKRVRGPSGTKSVDSVPTSNSHFETITDMAGFVISAIRAKAEASYPDDTTLIVGIELNSIYAPEQWRELEDLVRAGCPVHKFRRIFLCADLGHFSATIWGVQVQSTLAQVAKD